MGRSGTRHSKNAGTMGAEAQTYWEKKRLGYGTAQERLGMDSVLEYDTCWLTLQPAKDPMINNEGYIFSKEAILENLLAQKKEIKRQQLLYEASEKRNASEKALKGEENARDIIEKFDRANHAPIASASSAPNPVTEVEDAKAAEFQKFMAEDTKAFWLPSKTPECEKSNAKPKTDTVCPASGKKMRLKDLTPVRFTSSSGDDKGRHMCPISFKTFTKATKLVVIKQTGDVVSEQAYETVIKPEGVYKGHTVKAKDLIRIKAGGSGYSGSRAELQAKKFFHLGAHNGPADQRGQHRAGGDSAFGLRLGN